jgi:hypothetical protein
MLHIHKNVVHEMYILLHDRTRAIWLLRCIGRLRMLLRFAFLRPTVAKRFPKKVDLGQTGDY